MPQRRTMKRKRGGGPNDCRSDQRWDGKNCVTDFQKINEKPSSKLAEEGMKALGYRDTSKVQTGPGGRSVTVRASAGPAELAKTFTTMGMEKKPGGSRKTRSKRSSRRRTKRGGKRRRTKRSSKRSKRRRSSRRRR